MVANAQSVSLGWTEAPGAAGTLVQYWTDPFAQLTQDAGTNTSLFITNLMPGSTYCFEAFSYDTNNDLSVASTEILFTVPVPAIVVKVAATGCVLVSGWGVFGQVMSIFKSLREAGMPSLSFNTSGPADAVIAGTNGFWVWPDTNAAADAGFYLIITTNAP